MAKKTRNQLGLTERQRAAVQKGINRARGYCDMLSIAGIEKGEACKKGVMSIAGRLKKEKDLTVKALEIAAEFSILNCSTKKHEDACKAGISAFFNSIDAGELGPLKISGRKKGCR